MDNQLQFCTVEEAVEEMLNELWRKIKWQYGDYR